MGKRNIIYLYEKSADSIDSGKSAGFCKIDVKDNVFTIEVNIHNTRFTGEIKADDNLLKIADIPGDNHIVEVENENTIYNIDRRCMEKAVRKETEKNKEWVLSDLVKIEIMDITKLPRKYWKLTNNKFLMYGFFKYGHIGYIKKDNKYIICVPGSQQEQEKMLAYRFGFKTFVPSRADVDKEISESREEGYWIVSY